MSAKRSKRKMGRPPLPPAERKLPSMGFRPTRELRGKLEDAAVFSGRSKTQEIESRLEQSFSDQDVRFAEFGGEAIYQFMKRLARIAQIVEWRTNASFEDDAYTRAQAMWAMQTVLWAAGVHDAGAGVKDGRGVLFGDAPVGKEVAEGPGVEIGRELADAIFGTGSKPKQDQGKRTQKKRAKE